MPKERGEEERDGGCTGTDHGPDSKHQVNIAQSHGHTSESKRAENARQPHDQSTDKRAKDRAEKTADPMVG
jgi:hypothetical protein